MKKILLTTGMLLVFFMTASAQKAQNSFCGSHPQKTYKVEATQPNAQGRYYLEIEMQSLDDLSDEIYYRIASRRIPKWLKAFDEVKQTYLEWRKIAIENNVEDLSKKIKVIDAYSMFCEPVFKYADWHRARYAPLIFAFMVNKESIDLVVATGSITASDNQFITSKGGVIILSSEQEIDDFIACFDDGWVKEYYNAQRNVDELFVIKSNKEETPDTSSSQEQPKKKRKRPGVWPDI